MKDKNQVAHLVLETHGLGIAHGEAAGVQKIRLQVNKGFEQIGNAVHRITVVPVESNDDVAGSAAEAAFVGASVSRHLLGDDLGPHRSGDAGGTVGGVVVDHNDLVHEVGDLVQDQLYSFFLIETRNDYCDRLAFIHADIIVIVMKFLVLSLMAGSFCSGRTTEGREVRLTFIPCREGSNRF